MDIKRIGECSEHDEGTAECGPFVSLRFLIRTPLRANNQLRIPGAECQSSTAVSIGKFSRPSQNYHVT